MPLTLSPHDHQATLRTLEAAKKEITTMPSPKRVVARPVVEPEPQIEFPIEDDEPFDLEEELARVTAQLQEEEPPEVPPEVAPGEPTIRDQILQLLHEHPDCPTVEQVESWKAKYGKDALQVLALDSENVYVFTHLTWSQWEKVQKLSEAIQKQGNADAEKAMREAIVKAAVLWPVITPEWFKTCRAGLPQTLQDQVLMASYFLTPQQGLSLCTKL